MENLYLYLVLLVCFLSFLSWRFFKYKKIRATIPLHLKNGALIIDVRSAQEYRTNSAQGSLNIPLDELNQRSKSLDKNKTILLCCASGARSGIAKGILSQQGFKSVINIGPWTNAK